MLAKTIGKFSIKLVHCKSQEMGTLLKSEELAGFSKS